MFHFKIPKKRAHNGLGIQSTVSLAMLVERNLAYLSGLLCPKDILGEYEKKKTTHILFKIHGLIVPYTDTIMGLLYVNSTDFQTLGLRWVKKTTAQPAADKKKTSKSISNFFSFSCDPQRKRGIFMNNCTDQCWHLLKPFFSEGN